MKISICFSIKLFIAHILNCLMIITIVCIPIALKITEEALNIISMQLYHVISLIRVSSVQKDMNAK